jgi:hypothetical protein
LPVLMGQIETEALYDDLALLAGMDRRALSE